jgi:hypothetical protein
MNEIAKIEEEVKKEFENKEKTSLLLKRIGIGIGGIFILALTGTLLASALTAGIALSGLLVIGTVGIIAGIFVKNNFPRWVLSIENRVKEDNHREMLKHLENLKKNVKSNPIEQMENQYIEQRNKLEAFKENIKEFSAAIESAKRNLDNSKSKYPDTDFSRETIQINKMDEFKNIKKAKYNKANETLELFKNKVDIAREKWNLQLSANKAIAKMNNTDKDSLIQNILTEVAFEEVHASNDALFASLEMELNSMEDYKIEITKNITNQSNEKIIDVDIQEVEVQNNGRK